MHIYGYHSTGLFSLSHKKGLCDINNFCKEREYILSEMFTDYSAIQLDLEALKKVLNDCDIIILKDLRNLGKNKKTILKELTYITDNKIRVMILNKPDTLFDIPKNGDEIGFYYETVQTTNDKLLHDYAIKTKQDITHEKIASKAKLMINGKEIDYGAIPIKLRFGKIDTMNPLLIKAAREIVLKEYKKA